MRKQLFSLVVIVVIMMSMTTFTSATLATNNCKGGSATGGEPLGPTDKNFDYELDENNEARIIHWNKNATGNIVIPESVDGYPITGIYPYAFSYCSVESVTIPKTVTFIAWTAFGYCDSIYAIYVDENNPAYSSLDGVLFNKDKTELVYFPTSIGGKYCIPNTVRSINSIAFEYNKNLTELIIPKGVSTIESGTFASCTSLKSITLPLSIELIKQGSFYNCESLKNVYYQGNKEQIKNITIEDRNDALISAVWHFNSYPDITPEPEPTPDPEPNPEPTPTPTPDPKPEVEIKDTSKIFADIKENAWYKEYVDYAYSHNIFSGTDKGFSPDLTMTRAQFVQVFANISGVNTENNNVDAGFSDVKSGAWYASAVKWASENGIVSGVGNGKFDPNAPVTREQMCVMIVNYVENYQKRTLINKVAKADFNDDAQISGWAKDTVYKCQMAELISGTGTGSFAPKATATRAVGATIFTDFHRNYIK